MRVRLPQTALFLFFVALHGLDASAHPLKPTHSAPAHKPDRAAVHSRIEPPATMQTAGAHSGAKRERHPLARRVSERHAAPHLPASHGKDRRAGKHSDEPTPPANAVLQRHRTRSRAQDVAQEAPSEATHLPAAVEPPPVSLPPLEVRHNRKVHLAPAPAVAVAAPLKATVHDFLDTPANPPLDPNAEATPTDATPDTPAPATEPAPVVGHPTSIVERKPTPIPVVKAASHFVPDPVLQPVLYTARGHLIVPPALKGSREILLHQNEMADRDGLIRVQDDDDLERLRASKQLVALPIGPALEVDDRLPLDRRFCRPWTAQFLAAMASAHYARFHTSLQVNSAVRTVQFQERLRTTNGNAAPAEGETASPHLTGQAIDLAKHGLSLAEIAWMRGYLLPLVQQGKVDVEEEFQQACFHISVYKNYLPQPVPKREIPTRPTPATALAAAIR